MEKLARNPVYTTEPSLKKDRVIWLVVDLTVTSLYLPHIRRRLRERVLGPEQERNNFIQ